MEKITKNEILEDFVKENIWDMQSGEMLIIDNPQQMDRYYDKKMEVYLFPTTTLFNCEVTVSGAICAKGNLIFTQDVCCGDIECYNLISKNPIAEEPLLIESVNIDCLAILAENISADSIRAVDVVANNMCIIENICVHNLFANNVLYGQLCFAQDNIECNVLKSRCKKHCEVALNGRIKLSQPKKKKITTKKQGKKSGRK